MYRAHLCVHHFLKGGYCARVSEVNWFEPRHDKTNKVTVRPAKTQISMGIRLVWSVSSLCALWVAKDPSFLHADSEDSDQTGRMPRMIWIFAGRTLILLVLSCRGSFCVNVNVILFFMWSDVCKYLIINVPKLMSWQLIWKNLILLRFSLWTCLNAEEEEEAGVLVDRLDTTTTRYKMEIGPDKTKVMKNNPIGFQREIKIKGQRLKEWWILSTMEQSSPKKDKNPRFFPG